jgi:hypothetical protein
MTTKSINTSNGSKITVEMVREVQDKVAYLDGYNEVIGREIVEYTRIKFEDPTGKTIASGDELRGVNPRFDAKGIAGGAIGKVGNVYLRKDMYDMVAGLMAEVEAETPKSAEQIAIETARAEAIKKHDAWYNSPEQVSYRKFMREMEREDSDL